MATSTEDTSRPRAGRPTREQAEKRLDELLGTALDMFLERGFELTTVEAICARVGMTKRTVYARFDDKAALFRAAVERVVQSWAEPIAQLGLGDDDDLETSLVAIARMRAEGGLSPVNLKLQRMLNAEAWRFPDIFELAYRQGTLPAIRALSDLFARRAERGEIVAPDPDRLATAFLALVVGGITRGAVLGREVDQAALDAHLAFSVRLFLDGARTR